MKRFFYLFVICFILNSCVVYKFENYVTIDPVTLTYGYGNKAKYEYLPTGTTISFSNNKEKKGYAVYYKKKKWYLDSKYYGSLVTYSNYLTYYKKQNEVITIPNSNSNSNSSSSKSNLNSYKPTNSSGTVKVKGYYRKDGTYVRPHTRSAPKRK